MGSGDPGAGGGAGTSAPGGSAGSGMAGQLGSAGLSAAGGSSGSGGVAGSGPTAGSGPAAGGMAATGTLTVSELVIEPNPSMTLSCFVSWKTEEPASSEVQFGETGFAFRIRDAALVTEHRVLVIGMHASKKYLIKAVSSTASATGSAEGEFTAGKLPANIPTPMLTQSDFASSQVGWTLTNIQSGFQNPASIVMYDENGLPVWYFVNGTSGDSRGDISADLTPQKTVLVGPAPGEPAREVDLSGKVVWEGPANKTQTQIQTHFANKTPAGTYVINRELDKDGQNGSTRIDNQVLEEFSATNEIVWSWNMFDHVEPSGDSEELCHGNALTWDDTGGIAYYNCRYVGIFKIERSSGDVLWRMGGTHDEDSLGPGDFTFSPPESKFSDAHDPEFHADGTLLLYDNGGFAGLGGNNSSFRSRVVEYQLDQSAKTATRVWEFPGDFAVDAWYEDDWYTPYWGDADELANDNVLVTAGVNGSGTQSRIFEVTRAGKVVWELKFASSIGIYRAERLSPPPLVETIP
jgi:hypothetical protein